VEGLLLVFSGGCFFL